MMPPKPMATLPVITPALKHKGRPSKLTPLVQARLVEALRKGHAMNVAARLAGIGPTTFYTWLTKGKVSPQNPDPPRQFREFRECIKRAEAEAEDRLLTIVLAAAPSSWQAAMCLLERRGPQRWARRERRAPTDERDQGAPSWAWAQRVLQAIRTNSSPPSDLPENTPEDD